MKKGLCQDVCRLSLSHLPIVVSFLWALTVQATIIDFEGLGLNEGNRVGSIVTADNAVTFAVKADPPNFSPEEAYVAVYGGGAAYAFNNGYEGPDRPHGSAGAEGAFLTYGLRPPSEDYGWNYYITFSQPVSDLALDLYDFRFFAGEDGVPSNGGADLVAYSDSLTEVGHTTIAPPPGVDFSVPDGNVLHLSIDNPTAPIRSAALYIKMDAGTGIDNIKFSTVPDGGQAMLLLMFGLITIGAFGRIVRA